MRTGKRPDNTPAIIRTENRTSTRTEMEESTRKDQATGSGSLENIIRRKLSLKQEEIPILTKERQKPETSGKMTVKIKKDPIVGGTIEAKNIVTSLEMKGKKSQKRLPSENRTINTTLKTSQSRSVLNSRATRSTAEIITTNETIKLSHSQTAMHEVRSQDLTRKAKPSIICTEAPNSKRITKGTTREPPRIKRRSASRMLA